MSRAWSLASLFLTPVACGGQPAATAAVQPVAIPQAKSQASEATTPPTPAPPRHSCELEATRHEITFSAGRDEGAPQLKADFERVGVQFPGGNITGQAITVRGELRAIQLEGFLVAAPKLYLQEPFALQGWLAPATDMYLRPTGGERGALTVEVGSLEGLQLTGSVTDAVPCDRLGLTAVEHIDPQLAFAAPEPAQRRDAVLRRNATVPLFAEARATKPVATVVTPADDDYPVQRWERDAKRSRVLIMGSQYWAVVWVSHADVETPDNTYGQLWGDALSDSLLTLGSIGTSSARARKCEKATELFLAQGRRAYFLGTLRDEPILESYGDTELPEGMVAIALRRSGLEPVAPAVLALRRGDYEACPLQ